MEEKPWSLYKELDRQGMKPMFVIRSKKMNENIEGHGVT